jgi:(1->4)-alpha-D-glucan 1-alpha-D-glucosylmutase
VTPPRVATYRVQVTPDHDLDAVAGECAGIAELGVSHLYLSPVFEATPGSTHGYDVTDPTRVREELGGEAAFDRLVAAAGAAGLALLVDIVPNHMATVPDNPWWLSLLADGLDGPAGDVFDVFGEPVLLPILGSPDDEPPDWLPPGGHCRAVYWRDGGNYRRFFDINDLVGVRVEDPEVFDRTHSLILRWVEESVVDGLRVDHVDGLADPTGYLQRLSAAAPNAWLLVEKILADGEDLPDDWPVAGTTGYEAAVLLDQVSVDPAGEAPLTETYQGLTGDRSTWAETVATAKAEVLDTLFAQELDRLGDLSGDRAAVRDAILRLDRYRTYDATDERSRRFGQLSGPVMAKGVEDTAMYRYLRLVALNEVGGEPGRWGVGLDEFHRRAAAGRPHGLLAGTTHDTKRSESVRSRLLVLSQVPDRWADAVARWSGRHPFADPHAGYLVWQTLVGAWPLDADRLRGYVEKAVREAKLRTSWLDPDDAYESDLRVTVEGLFADADLLTDVGRFVDEIAPTGRAVDLGHLLLRCTMPGVPDLYQGSEDELLSLVDPDNRRPVDPAVHRASTPRAAVIRAALAVRREHPDAFGPDGSYEPLDLGDEVIGFVRGGEVATVVPRFGRADVAAVDLPGSWDDRLGDGPVRLLVRR